VLDNAAAGKAAISGAIFHEVSQTDTIRGAFIRFLLLGGEQLAPIHEKGLMLRGARIDGDIDLEGAARSHRCT
jgi:hypothetical protein